MIGNIHKRQMIIPIAFEVHYLRFQHIFGSMNRSFYLAIRLRVKSILRLRKVPIAFCKLFKNKRKSRIFVGNNYLDTMHHIICEYKVLSIYGENFRHLHQYQMCGFCQSINSNPNVTVLAFCSWRSNHKTIVICSHLHLVQVNDEITGLWCSSFVD